MKLDGVTCLTHHLTTIFGVDSQPSSSSPSSDALNIVTRTEISTTSPLRSSSLPFYLILLSFFCCFLTSVDTSSDMPDATAAVRECRQSRSLSALPSHHQIPYASGMHYSSVIPLPLHNLLICFHLQAKSQLSRYPNIFRVVQVLAYAAVSDPSSETQQLLVSHTLTLIENLLTYNDDLAGDIYKTGMRLLFLSFFVTFYICFVFHDMCVFVYVLIYLFCFVLFCFVLFCFVLFCFVLFCFVLFCFVLFCFVLFCFVLFCLFF